MQYRSIISFVSLLAIACQDTSSASETAAESSDESPACETVQQLLFDPEETLPNGSTAQQIIAQSAPREYNLWWERAITDAVAVSTAHDSMPTTVSVELWYEGGQIEWLDEEPGQSNESGVECFDHVVIHLDLHVQTADEGIDAVWTGTLTEWQDAEGVVLARTAEADFDASGLPPSVGFEVESQPGDIVELHFENDVLPLPASGLISGHILRSGDQGVGVLPFQLARFSSEE